MARKTPRGLPDLETAIRELDGMMHDERHNAEALVQAFVRLLDGLERVKAAAGVTRKPRHGDTSPFRYLGMTVIGAIEAFLDKAGPQTREAIIQEMIEGGTVMARQRPEVEVNKSIDYWLLTEAEKRYKYRKRKIKILPPRLKMVGDKIARIK